MAWLPEFWHYKYLHLKQYHSFDPFDLMTPHHTENNIKLLYTSAHSEVQPNPIRYSTTVLPPSKTGLFVCLLVVTWLVGWLVVRATQCMVWLCNVHCAMQCNATYSVHPGEHASRTEEWSHCIGCRRSSIEWPPPQMPSTAMKASFLFRARSCYYHLSTILSLLHWSNWSITFYQLHPALYSHPGVSNIESNVF